ncbi:MAG: site-specific tyrosine recombinase [Candidatus Planktophila sp.]
MNFHQSSDQFLNFSRIERGLSNNSLSAYTRDLQRFGDFLLQNSVDFREFNQGHLDNFLGDLSSAGLATSTVNRVLSTLRSFYAYLEREHGVSNPTKEVESRKIPLRLPKALSVSQITQLIDGSFHEDDSISFRNRAILELLYSTGGRVSEIVGINLSDISMVNTESSQVRVLKLRGKGNKERIVPMGSFSIKALDDYLVRVRPDLVLKNSKGKSDALFLNQRGSRISRQSAWQIVVDSAKKCGLSGGISPHVFRHSFATHLLDGGADIRVVQELLGHASVTTTQIYTLITIDKIRESYSLAHPRARS